MSAINASQMMTSATPAMGAPAAASAQPAGQPSFSDAMQRQHAATRDAGNVAVEGDTKPAHAQAKPAKPGTPDDKADVTDTAELTPSLEGGPTDPVAALVAPAPALTLQQQALEIARESAAFRRNAQVGEAMPTTAVKADDAAATITGPQIKLTATSGHTSAVIVDAKQLASTTSAAEYSGRDTGLPIAATGLLAARENLAAPVTATPTTALPAANERGPARLARDDPGAKLAADLRKPSARIELATAQGTGTAGALSGTTDARQAAIAAIAEASERMTSRKSALEAPAAAAQPAFTTAAVQLQPAAPMTAAPALHVATPFGAAEWGDAFGQQVAHLTTNRRTGAHTAELRLDPPDLGPIRVTLTIQDGTAHAAFSSAHGAVRQAIEASMSQLQQALAQSGIALGQSQVSDHGQSSGFDNAFAQSQGNNGSGSGSPGQGDRNGSNESGVTIALPTRAPRSLVDTFA